MRVFQASPGSWICGSDSFEARATTHPSFILCLYCRKLIMYRTCSQVGDLAQDMPLYMALLSHFLLQIWDAQRQVFADCFQDVGLLAISALILLIGQAWPCKHSSVQKVSELLLKVPIPQRYLVLRDMLVVNFSTALIFAGSGGWGFHSTQQAHPGALADSKPAGSLSHFDMDCVCCP
jgi:hypothetical protein